MHMIGIMMLHNFILYLMIKDLNSSHISIKTMMITSFVHVILNLEAKSKY